MTKISLILTISCLLASTLDAYTRKLVAEEETDFLRDICRGKEKAIELHFFVHDLSVNNPNTTTYDVAKASITDTSPSRFGTVRVIDDLVTAEGDAGSEVVGRMQGLVTRADLKTIGIALNVNIYFTTGDFAGSTISILGRNPINEAKRELSVGGGTGPFRFARGYAIQTTYSIVPNVSTVLEFNVYTTYNPNFV